MSNAARRDAPPGNYVANHGDGTLGNDCALLSAKLNQNIHMRPPAAR
jgi:hypothetical protein